MRIGSVWRRVGVAAAIAALGSCTPSQTASQSPATPQKLRVVTTILPITEFTKGVAGERAEVTQLLPATVDPHDFQAKPEDAQKLAKADVVVENGLELESYLDDLIKNTGQPRLKVIDSSQGIQPLANYKQPNDAFAGQSDHSSLKIGNSDHEEKYNPHIWLDPERAIQQVENIRDGLIAADPNGKDTYTANAAAYIAKLNQLNADFAQALKPYAGRTFVTYHDFAPYFAQRYNLRAQFLVGVPEENPSPEDVKRVISAAKNSNLKMLLTEPQATGNPFEALANDLNVQVSNFDSLEVSNADGTQSDYYFSVMRQNLKNLETALGQSQSLLPEALPTLTGFPHQSAVTAPGGTT